jgi:hypothetical protein
MSWRSGFGGGFGVFGGEFGSGFGAFGAPAAGGGVGAPRAGVPKPPPTPAPYPGRLAQIQAAPSGRRRAAVLERSPRRLGAGWSGALALAGARLVPRPPWPSPLPRASNALWGGKCDKCACDLRGRMTRLLGGRMTGLHCVSANITSVQPARPKRQVLPSPLLRLLELRPGLCLSPRPRAALGAMDRHENNKRTIIICRLSSCHITLPWKLCSSVFLMGRKSGSPRLSIRS